MLYLPGMYELVTNCPFPEYPTCQGHAYLVNLTRALPVLTSAQLTYIAHDGCNLHNRSEYVVIGLMLYQYWQHHFHQSHVVAALCLPALISE